MIHKAYEHGYGTKWEDFLIQCKEAYSTSVTDFHEHEFYEVNFILSGNVNILLKDKMEQGTGSFVVLTSPGTPHYISCKSDTLYKRQYLLFSRQFIANYVPEWDQLSAVFGKNGMIIRMNEERTAWCEEVLKQIACESERFRQRILILYLLSRLLEWTDRCEENPNQTPDYIMKTLAYIEEHYNERLVAADLASRFYISRTTFMTAFKKYTGITLNEYIFSCRMKQAIILLKAGKTQQEVAEYCGFNDSSSLNRAFQKRYHMTPRQYVNQ